MFAKKVQKSIIPAYLMNLNKHTMNHVRTQTLLALVSMFGCIIIIKQFDDLRWENDHLITHFV